MKTKVGGKLKGSKRRVIPQQAGPTALRKLIEGVIDAQHRGDHQQRDAALRALEKFQSHGPAELRQRAVEARAAASNAIPRDSSRLLSEIAARLETGTRAG